MEVLLYALAALTAYLVAGWNPAITFSKAVYKKDIRTCGSGNPGFTNFRRTFGNKLAWWVLALDLSKAAVVVVLYACLFAKYSVGAFSLGAAYTGVFAMLGHAFPVWYGFKGGKGFLVCMSIAWVMDWRVGLFAFLLMTVLLLTTKYMSLSTVVAMLCAIAVFAVHKMPPIPLCLYAACAVFMAVRHMENFKRLVKGTESKFYLFGKKKA